MAIIPVAGTSLNGTAATGVFYLRVRAVNGAGQSPPSNEIVLVVP